ncbi:MAG: GNAT family N-acetyltransferase [Henriciella sp.]|uniref:GNAT family N-acetyltransferase n=1 Tax=Henriciella sp. TaxID=1968823 RepID=UPI003C728ED4
MPIRPYRPSDLPALTAINGQCVPNVSAEEEESLEALIDMGTCLVAADHADRPLGFINLVEPGEMAYPSDNLRWLERWMAEGNTPDMIYVDRIAIGKNARNQGLGVQLYSCVFDQFAHRCMVSCEINSDPPNPGSRRFHERLGFWPVGGQRYRPGYAVQFFVRGLG